MVEKMKRYVDYLRRLAGIALLPLVVAACESGDGDDATPLPEPPKQKNSYATVSLVSGIFGLLTLCCMAFPIAIRQTGPSTRSAPIRLPSPSRWAC